MIDAYITIKPIIQGISHEWRTSVLDSAFDGGEQRSTLFTWPRVNTKVTFASGESRLSNWLRRKLMQYVDGVFGIPLWPDHTRFSSDSTAGDATVNYETTVQGESFDINDTHFCVGREIILLSQTDELDYETGIIQSIDTDAHTITLSSATSLDHSTRDYIIPIIPCRINSQQVIGRQPVRYDELSLTGKQAYDNDSTSYVTYSVPADESEIYRGRYVFQYEPVDALEHGFYRPYTEQKYIGIGHKWTNRTDSVILLNQNYMISGRDNIWDAIRFFDNKRGRWQSFFVPTWNKDVIVTQAISAGDVVLHIEDLEYTSVYLPNAVIGRYLMIKMPNGQIIYRKVNTATNSQLVLIAPIPNAVAESDLSKLYISFLTLVRFDLDELMIEYNEGRGHVAQFKMKFKGLINETYGITEQGFVSTGNFLREDDDNIYPASYQHQG